jgi:NAD-dependent deacetylase
MVYPAASLAPYAKQAGAFVIEVNPDETPISAAVHDSIRGPAGEVLPQILQ